MKDSRRELRVGILGAGIMGCSLALFLARRRARVSLIDEAPAPFSRTSRWNEGKIHLGYLYAGDPTLATARRLIDGGLAFGGLVGQLLDSDLASAMSLEDDIILTHRDSIVDAQSMSAYFDGVSKLVTEHPEAHLFVRDLKQTRATRLTSGELAAVTGSPDIVAGFRVPERSIQTNWLADRYVEAVAAEPLIETVMDTRVRRVTRSNDRWQIDGDGSIPGPFDVVINALWQGGPTVDEASGFGRFRERRSFRYRLSVFLRTARPCHLPNAVIGIGPFGDIKNYNGRDLYLSWYPAGLIAETEHGPVDFALDADLKNQVATNTFRSLREYFPQIAEITQDPAALSVAGGWVVAKGSGSLADPLSSLHRRDRFGVTSFGSYSSIDTGKFSTAPWLAHRLAAEIIG